MNEKGQRKIMLNGKQQESQPPLNDTYTYTQTHTQETKNKQTGNEKNR